MSESRSEALRVVAAFIAPNNSQWQGSTVNVTEDGSWWRWTGTEWARDTAPLPSSLSEIATPRDPEQTLLAYLKENVRLCDHGFIHITCGTCNNIGRL